MIILYFFVGLILGGGSAYMFLTFVRDDIRSERKKKKDQQVDITGISS